LRYSGKILTLALLLACISCERIERKGEAVVDKTKQAASATKRKIINKTDQVVDKVFPTYDAGQADTDKNKKRFVEHLQVDLTPDVKNIYAYGDFLGIDYKVLISFSCDQTTIDEIITTKKMQLAKSKEDHGLFFSSEVEWWDKDKIEMLVPYKVGKELEYWEYLWYDPKTKQAYYEEFSL
jgi:hypothetical protein